MSKKIKTMLLAIVLIFTVIPCPAYGMELPEEVYFDPFAQANGEGTKDDPVRTIEQALESVRQGGIIWLRGTWQVDDDVEVDGKGTIMKPDMSPYDDGCLISVQAGGSLTVSNMTLDGSTYKNKVGYYNMVEVLGNLTLGSGAVLENFAATNYGAALAVTTDGSVTVDGGIIRNNKCSPAGSYGGGVYVTGTLKLVNGSIKGNEQSSGQASDISLYDSGKLELSGNAQAGTVIFHHTSPKVRLQITSKLENQISVREDKTIYGNLIPDLGKERIVAEGMNYTLSEEDLGMITAPSSDYFSLELNGQNQITVGNKSYPIIIDDKMSGGTVSVTSQAKVYDRVSLKPQAEMGYIFSEVSVSYQDRPDDAVSLTEGTETGTYEFLMPAAAVVVSARFAAIPAEIPVIKTQVPLKRAVLEGGETELKVEAKSTDNGTLSYQWYKDSRPIQDATADTLKLSGAAQEDKGSYYVVVVNTTVTGLTAMVQSSTCALTVTACTFEVEFPDTIATYLPDKSKVLDMILNKEDLVQIANGADISVLLKVTEVTQAVDAETVTAALKEKEIVGMYLDIELVKRITGLKDQIITQTDKPIQIVFAIPTNLQMEGREFSIIRVHGGAATTLSDLDNNQVTFTMETDRFSTYALIYTQEEKTPEEGDTPIVPVPPADDIKPPTGGTDTTTTGTGTVNTDTGTVNTGTGTVNTDTGTANAGPLIPVTGDDNIKSMIFAFIMSTCIITLFILTGRKGRGKRKLKRRR